MNVWLGKWKWSTITQLFLPRKPTLKHTSTSSLSINPQINQDGSRSRSSQPCSSGWGTKAQAEDSRPSSTILLHGRQVPRLLHNHYCFLARTDCRHLRRLLDCPMPAYWWQGQAHRGLLLPKEVDGFTMLQRCKERGVWCICKIEDGFPTSLDDIVVSRLGEAIRRYPFNVQCLDAQKWSSGYLAANLDDMKTVWR